MVSFSGSELETASSILKLRDVLAHCPPQRYTHAPEQHPTEGEVALNYLSTSRQRWAAQARQFAIA